MTLTDQELDQFLDEVGVFSDEKLSTERERPELPKLPEPPKPKNKLLIFAIFLAFIFGVSVGLATKNFTTGRQFTYIVQKLNELENSKDLIEPLNFSEEMR